MALRVTTLVANPAPASRTLAVGEAVSRALLDHLALPNADYRTLDLACDAGGMFDASSAPIAALMRCVADSHVVVIASPVYKASFTGLLKAFFDRFEPDALSHCIGIPVMVGGTARHALAIDTGLRPLMVEMGMSVPTRGLFVLATDLAALGSTIDAWSIENLPLVARLLPSDR